MHPGNILVRTKSNAVSNGIFKSGPQLVFLDVGMTAELSKRDRLNLIEFFKAVALRDGRTAAECTLRLSNKQSCPNPEAFIKVTPTSNCVFFINLHCSGLSNFLVIVSVTVLDHLWWNSLLSTSFKSWNDTVVCLEEISY